MWKGNETELGNLVIKDFDRIIVAPKETRSFAKVVYSNEDEGSWGGELVLATNDTTAELSRIEIPYVARVMFGSLAFITDQTRFRTLQQAPTNITRTLMFSNNFPEPVRLFAARVTDPHFKVAGYLIYSIYVCQRIVV